ncbi:MAG: 4a-hydroxytetrahydrobiopterin dehydratase [Nanoarchaeota archaeon]
MQLESKKCTPCEGHEKLLVRQEFRLYLDKLKDWTVLDDKLIEREFDFKNFKEAMNFVNKVAEISEKENHHPNILIHMYNKVIITLYTHAINGLSINDFILASKIEKIKH